MILTEREKEICKQYGKRGIDGKVNCKSCPLVIDIDNHICKANVSKEFIDKHNASKN
jgi:RNA polymerase subunit RPABC4/transcription elongation factor Spt4